MKLDFQRHIASSQSTLPVVGVLAVVLWILLPVPFSSFSYSVPDYGLWHLLPASLQQGRFSLGIGLGIAALAVYVMVELNNANVLLRTSSRMLGCMLAFLLAWAVVTHPFQPGHILMFATLLSFFPLFATYQQPHPVFSFIVHLFLSVASLFFPMFLWVVPAYWLIQGYFRALSLRCWIASLLAILLPYWFYGGVAVLTDSLPAFWTHLQVMADIRWGDYSQVELRDLLTFGLLFLLFLTGAIDFYIHQFLDKTRIRIIYNALIFHGVVILLFICLQPHYFSTLLPLMIVDTAILFGHFFTLTHSRFSHIICLILLLLALCVLAVQYLPHLLPLINALN